MKFRFLLTGAAIVFLAQTSQSMAFYWEGVNPYGAPPISQSGCAAAVASSIKVYGSDNYFTGCVTKFPNQTIAEFWAIWDPQYGYLGARPGVASLRCEAGESSSDFGCVQEAPARDPQCPIANPIDVFTGEKIQSAIDFRSDSSIGLKIERFYSRNGKPGNNVFANSSIGRGWKTNFDSLMYVWDGNTNQVILPNGREFYFTKVAGEFKQAYFDKGNLRYVLYTRSKQETLVHTGTTYELTLADGTVNVYSDESTGSLTGKLVQVRKPDGGRLSLSYTDGLLTQVTDSLGRVATFVRGLQGNRSLITEIKIDGTAVVNYSYLPGVTASELGDSFPNGVPNEILYGIGILRSVSYPLAPNESVTYGYDDPVNRYALTSITDAKNVVSASWTYDGSGRAISSQHAGGTDATSIAYDDANKRVTVTNALGKQTQINYADTTQGSRLQTSVDGIASANCLASNLSYEYDANEYPSRTTDPEGRITTFVNNSLGLPTTITRGYGTASAETVDLTWDTTLRKPLTMVRPALTTTYVWNPSGTLASVTQTDTTSQSVPYATNGQTRTWAYTYDTRGLVTAVDGPLAGTSDTTTYVYTTAGNLETVTDPAGLVTTFTAWNSRGQPTSITDPNGTVVAFEYDGMGRLKTVSQDVGNTPLVWSITYDVVGNITRIDEPSGSFRLYAWDGARRLTSVTDPTGGTMALARNGLGNITEVKISTDTAGTDVTYRDTRTYDELGRLMRLVTGTNRTWAQTWDRSDLPITVTDPRANTTTNTFDAVARLLNVRHEDNGVETVAYDTNGRVSSYTDPGTKATTWVRNGFGDIIKETSPDRGATVYEYDARGLVTKKTDARGVVANYAYDVAGRLVSKTYPASTAENVTITWDSVASGNKGKGHPTSIVDRSGTTAWTWDAKGRITTEVRTIGSIAHTTSYLWNAQGRLGRVTYPSGHYVDYGYNTDGRILSIQMGAPGIDPISGVWGTTYLPFGGLSGIGYGNGLAWHATFDQAYGIDRIEVISYPDTSGPTVFDRLHPHSDGMNITALDDQQDNGRDATFGYDAANRVNSATTTEAGVQQTWGWVWDQTGNRLTETQTPDGGATTTRTYAYVSGTNRLSTVTEGATTLRAFTYDAAGNPTRDTRSGVDTDYTYDDAGRLRTVTVAGSPKATYTYDGLERLAIRTLTNQTPSGTTHFIHMLGGGGAFDELAPGLGEQFGGLGNRIIGETDGAGNLVREYVWLDDLIIAVVSDANTASPQIWWVTNDHLGRPVQMTDWSKTVVWRANHRPFGEVTAVTGTASLDARFPGQWFQLESGLAYNWHRHYDASISRYTQPDPLGVKAGPSVYGYAGGNPMMGVDPEGLDQLVCLYPDAASGAGHVGFGDPKNNYTEGFYPKNGGLSGPGEIRRDEYDSKECKTVKSDPDQDQCMQNCKEERKSNPGMYSLTGRQCTSFVRSCMSKCGLKTDGYDGPRPKRFFRGF